MAKRQSINDQEQARLVRALIETKDWEVAKSVLPDVDPKALDKGFKAFAFKKAGLKLEEPAPPAAPPALPKKGDKPDPLK